MVPCSALVINNWGWPHGCFNLMEPPGSVASPTALLSPREGSTRGLGTGAALRSRLAYAPPGPSGLVDTQPSRAQARLGQVWGLFVRQGVPLGIVTQGPNWSRSPSLPGLVLVSGQGQRRLRYARGRALPTENIKA